MSSSDYLSELATVGCYPGNTPGTRLYRCPRRLHLRRKKRDKCLSVKILRAPNERQVERNRSGPFEAGAGAQGIASSRREGRTSSTGSAITAGRARAERVKRKRLGEGSKGRQCGQFSQIRIVSNSLFRLRRGALATGRTSAPFGG